MKLKVFLTLPLLITLAGIGLAGDSVAVSMAAGKVLFVGDSLQYETSTTSAACPLGATCHTPTIQEMMASKAGWQAEVVAMPNKAPCDFESQMESLLASFQPTVVVYETFGNSSTPCMIDPATGQYYVTGSAAYYSKYSADLTLATTAVLGSGAKMVLVKPPTPGFPSQTGGIAQTMVNVAMANPGTSVTAGPKNAVTNSGVYTQYKACQATETAAMGCLPNGKIDVRAPDRFHFCPTGFSYWGCSVYDSGADRFGKAEVQAAINPPASLVS